MTLVSGSFKTTSEVNQSGLSFPSARATRESARRIAHVCESRSLTVKIEDRATNSNVLAFGDVSFPAVARMMGRLAELFLSAEEDDDGIPLTISFDAFERATLLLTRLSRETQGYMSDAVVVATDDQGVRMEWLSSNAEVSIVISGRDPARDYVYRAFGGRSTLVRAVVPEQLAPLLRYLADSQ